MQKVRLGNTGLMVTKFGFGGIPIMRVSEEYGVKLVQKAVQLGMNWVDTANGYGESEERIGKALESFDRESVMIFTKGGGKTRGQLEEQIRLSLERLRVDYIDVYQFYGVRKEAWKEMLENGAVDLVVDYRERGVLRHVAASSHDSESLLIAMDHFSIEVVQWPFNFVVQDEASDILTKCREKNIGFIAMKPFGGGVFPEASPCIRFFMQYQDIVSDPGFEKIEQVEEVVNLAERVEQLSEQDRREMDVLRKELGRRFCRRCGYCMPCSNDVAITSLMTLPSMIKRLPPERVFTESSSESVASVGNCIECGECEEKCPYKLPIRERIREEAENYYKLLEDRKNAL